MTLVFWRCGVYCAANACIEQVSIIIIAIIDIVIDIVFIVDIVFIIEQVSSAIIVIIVITIVIHTIFIIDIIEQVSIFIFVIIFLSQYSHCHLQNYQPHNMMTMSNLTICCKGHRARELFIVIMIISIIITSVTITIILISDGDNLFKGDPARRSRRIPGMTMYGRHHLALSWSWSWSWSS